MSRGRRGRDRGTDRRVSFRGGGLLRPKRRPASREGGFLRSDRRPNRGTDGDGTDGDVTSAGNEAERDGGAPEVRIRRSARGGSPPVAKVTTLVVLLFMVLAVIFLL